MTPPDYVDFGARCPDHVGEAFPPRCAACAQEAVVITAPSTVGECQLHAEYICGGIYGPCAKCERESDRLERRSLHR